MDNFELTKIAGAVLAALLLIVGTKTLIETKNAVEAVSKWLYAAERPMHRRPAKPLRQRLPRTLPRRGEHGRCRRLRATAAAAAPAGGGDAVALLAKASADNGKAMFAKCKSCHAVEKGKNARRPKPLGRRQPRRKVRRKASAIRTA